MLKLTGIHIYPIKSLAGISLSESMVEERGLKYDRRWMLVDESGMFMTQRKIAKMALFKTAIEYETLVVTAPDNDMIKIPLSKELSEIIEVKIWDDECLAYALSERYDQWFSDKLGMKCRIVYMGDQERLANADWVQNNEKVSYADGYQYLIVGKSSLNDLNERMDEDVPMNRFRPNLVFSGGEAFDEDNWIDFKVGEVSFYGIKPCARCLITTIDQNTSEKNTEPLITLSKFRKWDNKIFFGLNAAVADAGVIRVGDQIEVSNKKT